MLQLFIKEFGEFIDSDKAFGGGSNWGKVGDACYCFSVPVDWVLGIQFKTNKKGHPKRNELLKNRKRKEDSGQIKMENQNARRGQSFEVLKYQQLRVKPMSSCRCWLQESTLL